MAESLALFIFQQLVMVVSAGREGSLASAAGSSHPIYPPSLVPASMHTLSHTPHVRTVLTLIRWTTATAWANRSGT